MKRFEWFSVVLFLILMNGCARKEAEVLEENIPKLVEDTVYTVTFLEFGSKTCVPCRQMIPVMRSVEETYGDQVKVIFHDVKTDEGSAVSRQYSIHLIPTQVFLNSKGEEVFRHEGYFPIEEVVQVLKTNGVETEK